MDALAIYSRDTINAEFDEGLALLIGWKKLQYDKRRIIENLGSDAALADAHREESDLRNSILRWAAQL